jgi:hypothetical protein
MKELIGNFPKESGFIAKFRQHQGWWRTFVLNEEEGKYWDAKNEKYSTVCNRINNGEKWLKNFLSEDIAVTAKQAVEKNKKDKSGIIDEDRLYNNLLSSQPLAFNFFGFFKANPDIALAFLQSFRPDITAVEDVVFEYAPQTSDHSAFDFGFVIRTEAGIGFWGFECKYTDTFSFKRKGSKVFYGDKQGDDKDLIDKNYENYHSLYVNHRNRFPDDYFTYVRNSNYNQLFRNELLAVQLKSYDFIITGLFCHQEDRETVKAGLEFQKKIGNGCTDFLIITYADYFEHMQKLTLSWEQRELIMLLWARYCGLQLSDWVSVCIE